MPGEPENLGFWPRGCWRGARLLCVQGEWAGETVGPDVWETCRELIPAGSVFAFLAEHRERLLPSEMFADMYPSANGRPSLPPQVLAATVVLQSLFGTSDVETVLELRCDLSLDPPREFWSRVSGGFRVFLRDAGSGDCRVAVPVRGL